MRRRALVMMAATMTMAALLPAAQAVEVGTNDFRISDMGPPMNTAYRGQDAAIAYNSTNDLYLVVWYGDDDTGGLADDEFEIWGQLIKGSDGSAVGSNFRISDAGGTGVAMFGALAPDVAYNPTNNEFLVVWKADETTDGEDEIYIQRLDGATGAEKGTNDQRISDMGPAMDPAFDATRPAVVYSSTGNRYLVVWQGEDIAAGDTEIWGQFIDGASGAELGADDFQISSMAFSAADPDIALNSANGEYLVVWRGRHNLAPVSGENEIFAQRLTSTGAEIGADDFRISDMGPDGNTDASGGEPAVAFNPTQNEYLVVWEGDNISATLPDDEEEIWGQRLSATGSEIGPNDFRISTRNPDGTGVGDASDPAVAFSVATGRYFVVWEGNDGTLPPGKEEIFGQQLLGGTGAEIGGDDVRLSDMGPPADASFDAAQPAIATSNPFLIAWHGDDDTPPLMNNEREIFGQRWANAAPTAAPDVGTVAEGGTLSSPAPALLGNDTDPEGDPLSAAKATDPANGTVTVNADGSYTYTHNGSETTTDSFTYTASDGAAQGTGTVTITVTPVNDAPVAVGDAFAATQGITTTVAAPGVLGNDTDAEGSPLTAQKVTDPAHGTLTLNPDGSFTYAHDGSASIGDSFTYRVSDGSALSNVTTVLISVVPISHGFGGVDPDQGLWTLRDPEGKLNSFFYGNPGDVPVMGDWNCDGDETPGLFRTSDAFAYLRNSNSQGIADVRFFFGNPSDVPLAGDWNGNGCDTLSIYRPSEQRFYIINALGQNEGGLGAADFNFEFGNPGDKAVVGDWDGDGIDEIGLHRESTGFFYWRNSLDTGIASGEIFFGDPGDRFIAGDWGVVDGKDTPGVFRPSDQIVYLRYTLTQGNADAAIPFGQPSSIPVSFRLSLTTAF